MSKHQKQYLLLLTVFTIGMSLIMAFSDQLQRELTTKSVIKIPEKVEKTFVPDNSYQMKITAFSGIECKTSWCQENKDLPRGQKVALNGKYGKWSKVYIPAYDKYYDVIGTTDCNTDLDIWFASDRESALKFGTKKLLVNLIK